MFSFDVEASEIFLFDEIGPEWAGMVGGSAVVDALKQMGGKDVTMYLSTPGGSIDEGTIIYNVIERYAGKVRIVVDSIAASMGSYILQAADERIVASNAKLMIHNPWGVAIGDAAEMRSMADVLDKYGEALVAKYAERSGKDEKEVRKLMNAETWYLGQEIVDAGFADSVGGVATKDIDAKALARWARNIPAAVQAELSAPKREQAKTEAMRMTVQEAKKKIAAMQPRPTRPGETTPIRSR